ARRRRRCHARRWAVTTETIDLAGAGVVVTGGGKGIGAALAARFAAEGARVVVADLDGDAASAVAERVGGTAVAGDAASAEGVRALVGAARDALGEIDLFCANAGIAVPGGPDASEEGGRSEEGRVGKRR